MRSEHLSYEELERIEANRQHRALRRRADEQAIRELQVDAHGVAHTVGDERGGFDFDDIALANLGIESEPSDRQWVKVDELPADPDQIWGETEEEIEVYADGNETDGDIDDDTVGGAIFDEPEEVEDAYSRLDAALNRLRFHPLVKHYGFPPDMLITDVGGNPVPMGYEVLAITLAACRAADELANLAGPEEVCKVLRWTGKMPSALKAFGANRFFRFAGALQARVQEIKTERSRLAPRLTLTLPSRTSAQTPAPKTGGIKPRSALTAPQAKPVQARVPRPAPQPVTPALKERIRELKLAATRLGSPGAEQKLDQALATTHSRERALRLVREAEQMLRNCEASARTQPSPAPAAPTARNAPRIGKTERERMKKLVKAGKMSQADYELQTGHRL